MWEANHVWLIYILVFLRTAFPESFAAIMNTLFIPWMIVGLGIVLRGGAFAFRKFSSTFAEAIGARSTQTGLVIVFALAAVTVVPSLIWLYVLVNTKAGLSNTDH